MHQVFRVNKEREQEMKEKTKLESVVETDNTMKRKRPSEKEIEMEKQIEAISQENKILRATIEKLKNVIVAREVELFDKRCAPAPKPTV